MNEHKIEFYLQNVTKNEADYLFRMNNWKNNWMNGLK